MLTLLWVFPIYAVLTICCTFEARNYAGKKLPVLAQWPEPGVKRSWSQYLSGVVWSLFFITNFDPANFAVFALFGAAIVLLIGTNWSLGVWLSKKFPKA